MVVPSVEILENFAANKAERGSFRTYRDWKAGDFIYPPENRALAYTKKTSDLFAAYQFGKVVHFHHLFEKERRLEIWRKTTAAE